MESLNSSDSDNKILAALQLCKLNLKCVLVFLYNFLKIFLILGRMRNISNKLNIKYPLFFSHFNEF